jgi:hypothetical protein
MAPANGEPAGAKVTSKTGFDHELTAALAREEYPTRASAKSYVARQPPFGFALWRVVRAALLSFPKSTVGRPAFL